MVFIVRYAFAENGRLTQGAGTISAERLVCW